MRTFLFLTALFLASALPALSFAQTQVPASGEFYLQPLPSLKPLAHLRLEKDAHGDIFLAVEEMGCSLNDRALIVTPSGAPTPSLLEVSIVDVTPFSEGDKIACWQFVRRLKVPATAISDSRAKSIRVVSPQDSVTLDVP